MMRNFTFLQQGLLDPSALNLELVERKGNGHPDTLADAVAEETSRRYADYCLQQFGAIAHHWFDKVMLLGGEANTEFLGGKIIRPVHAVLAGKAVLRVGSEPIPLQEIFEASVHTVFSSVLKNYRFEDYCRCEIRVQDSVGPGQRSIRYRPQTKLEIKEFESGNLVSNDCNLCVGYAPNTASENLTLDIERFLLSPQQQALRPWLGSDIKTVTTRQGEKTHILVNVPMLASYVPDLHTYQSLRADLEAEVCRFCGDELKAPCDVIVNPEWIHGRVYLTATGTCLDTGDIGVVGRGNRHSGLITPMRGMSIEASAGKNPLDHTGKLLNVAAMDIGAAIYSELGVASTVHLFAKKGDRLEEPSLTSVRCDSGIELPENFEEQVKDICFHTLSHMHQIRKSLLVGTKRLY